MLNAGNPELNFVLETVNGIVLILSFPLLIVLTHYIIAKLRQRKQPMRRMLLSVPAVPTVLALALALYLDKLGVLMTRLAVWTWRRFGNGLTGGPMNDAQEYLLLIGTPLCAIGLLWLIAILSRPRFGNWPWLASAGMAAMFMVATVTRHLWFGLDQ